MALSDIKIAGKATRKRTGRTVQSCFQSWMFFLILTAWTVQGFAQPISSYSVHNLSIDQLSSGADRYVSNGINATSEEYDLPFLSEQLAESDMAAETGGATQHNAPLSGTAGRPISDFLDEGGTFHNSEGYSGSIDLAGFTMDVSAEGAPMFMMSGTVTDDNWHPLGSGLNDYSNALAVHGDNLYVGGRFTTADGLAASYIARYDINAGTWHGLGSGVDAIVHAFAVHGDNLYVGGVFNTAGNEAGRNRIARFDMSATTLDSDDNWHGLGSGLSATVNALAVHGDNLYVGGNFTTAGNVAERNHIARFDMSPTTLDSDDNWYRLGSGLGGSGSGSTFRVNALTVHGNNLYVGGNFTTAGNVAGRNHIARFDMSATTLDSDDNWYRLGSGLSAQVYAFAVHGTNLYVGGMFYNASGKTVNRIARFDLSATTLDSDDNWYGLGSGVAGTVFALAVHGNKLYVGGNYTTAGGTAERNRITRFDLSATTLDSDDNWHTLGSGLSSDQVNAFAIHDTNLYVGGNFSSAGGKTVNRIARLSGLAAKPATVSLSSPGTGTSDVALQPALSWGSATDATSYELQVSTSSNLSSPVINQTELTATSLTLSTALSRATTYYWRVRGDNDGINGDWSGVRSFTTIPNVPVQVALSAPVNEATDIALRPAFSWAAASGASTYQIQVSTASDLSSPVIDQSGLSATQFQTGSDLSQNTTYHWRVRAVNAGGSGAWSAVRSFTTIPDVPAQVALSAPADGAANTALQPELSWSAATHATSYELQVSVQSDLSRSVIDINGVTATTYTPSVVLDRAATYYWRVRGVNLGVKGEWSTIRSFTTIPDVPAQVALSAPADGAANTALQPELSWTAASGSSSYELQLSADPGFSEVSYARSGLTATTYTPSSVLARGITYYWRIRGVNAGGSGAWSAVRSFTTIPDVPAQVALSAPADGQVLPEEDLSPNFSWQQATGAQTYRLELSASPEPTFAGGLLYSSDPVSETSFTLPESVELEYSTAYYWRVRGVNPGGNGPAAEPRSFTTGSVAPPQSIQLTIGSDGQILIRWEKDSTSSRIEFFDIYCGSTPTNLVFCERLDADQFDTNIQGSSANKVSHLTSQESEYFALRAVISETIKSALSDVVNVVEITGQIPDQWSLISLPIDDDGVEVESSALFSFSSNNYKRETLLAPGRAYWARSDTKESYTRRAPGLTRTSLDLVSGWNLLGGLVSEVAVADIADPDSVLGVTPIYGWTGEEYVPADSLAPFEGYWIYADKPGTIELRLRAQVGGQTGSDGNELVAANSMSQTEQGQSGASAAGTLAIKGQSNHIDQVETPQTLVITAADQSRSLQLFPQGLPGETGHWLLPPRGPGERMDLRTSEGLSAVGSPRQAIDLSGGQWPLSVMVSGQGNPDYGWVLSGRSGQDRMQVNLLPEQSVQLSEPLSDLLLEQVRRDQMIFDTELMSGYPNPFNPSVNLRYRLAMAEDVSLQIYDVAGRRVATLVNARQQPGSYTVQFNGASLSSGIYFVRLRSGSTLAVQKISLIK